MKNIYNVGSITVNTYFVSQNSKEESLDQGDEDAIAREVFKRMGTQLIMWEQKETEALYDIKLHSSSGLMFHPV